ncbi:MAG: PAS domain S-box protein, partial [Promethearchaeota archaeon]
MAIAGDYIDIDQFHNVILAHTSNLIAYLDPKFNFIRVNKAYAAAYNRDVSFFPNKNYFDLYPNNENEKIFNRVMETGEPYFIEANLFEYVDRSELGISYKDWNLIPVKDSENIIKGLVLIVQKVSNYRRDEDILRENEEMFRKMIEYSPDVISIMAKDGKILYQSPSSKTIFGYKPEDMIGKNAFDFIHPDDRSGVINTFIEGFERIDSQISKIGKIEYRFRNFSGSWRNVEAHRSRIMEFDDIQAIVVNSRDITDHKRAKQKLKESKDMFAKAFYSGPNNMAITRMSDGLIIDVNKVFIKSFGYEREELIGHTITELDLWKNPDLWQIFMRNLQEHNENHNFEFQIQKKSGEIRWMLLSGEIIDLDNKLHLISMTTDITECKQIEAALRESKEKFRSLVETTSDWVWEVNSDGIYTYSSPKVKELLGYHPKEIIGKTPFDLMPVYEAKRVYAIFNATMESRTPFERLENINIHKEGYQVVLETSGVPVFDNLGRFMGYRGIDRDITERKQAEKALKKSRAKYRSIINNITDTIVETDANGKIFYVSPQIFETFGFLPEEIIGNNVFDYCYPKDIQLLIESFEKAMDLKIEFNFDLRVQHKAGYYIFVSIRGGFLKMDGEIRLISVLRDITKRKIAEQKLKESEEKYRNLFENIRSGVAIYKPVDDGEDFIFKDFNK